MSIKKSNEQIYGRNNQVMLEMHDKIYGSLGISEQYVLNTVKGNPVVLSNPKSGKLNDVVTEFQMQGWTDQAQYEGNQLFDASVFDEMEKSGVSVSVDNGVITASGMSESTIWIQSANMTEEDFKKFKSGNIYVKNYKTSECNYEVGIYINNTTVKEGNSPYPIPGGYLETKPNNVYFFINIRAGIELKGSCKPMIYQDGNGTWEPYTGGQPSPNPDYPQEITSAGKYDEGTGKWKYEVKLTGANLFNPDGERVSGLYMGTPLHNKSSVCMQLYEKDPDVDVTGCYIGLSKSGISAVGGLGWALSNGNLNDSGLTATASMDTHVTWYPASETILQKIINRYDVMVNIGVQPLPYQPYKEQTVLLTSDRPLTKWDKLEKWDGQWGWVYKSAEIVLDGGEYWMLYTNNKSENLYGFQHNISNLVMKNTLEERGFIDKIPSISRGISSTNKMAAQFGYQNTTLYILLSREYFSEHSVSALTEWLSENPLMVLYETSEETFVPLSESEQEQMNELEIYIPTTVISNNVMSQMKITYKATQSLEV